MATETIAESPDIRTRGQLSDYWALTKPEINFLIAIATSTGFYLGSVERFPDFALTLLVHTLAGTLLVASGTGTLNQYVERHFDTLMRRTSRRPVASGRIQPSSALWFGIGLSVAGTLYLAVAVNALASLLAVLTLLGYLFLYTPLKRRTPLCVLVGAFAGATPPLIGWAASTGGISIGGWVLYAILFLWQFPHFMAIAWMYRGDYAAAGYFVLPRIRLMTLQTIVPLLALIPVSLLAPVARHGVIYPVGASFLSLGFLYHGAQFAILRSNSSARRLLSASILYLAALLVLMFLVTV